jgi:hypothetical protein
MLTNKEILEKAEKALKSLELLKYFKPIEYIEERLRVEPPDDEDLDPDKLAEAVISIAEEAQEILAESMEDDSKEPEILENEECYWRAAKNQLSAAQYDSLKEALEQTGHPITPEVTGIYALAEREVIYPREMVFEPTGLGQNFEPKTPLDFITKTALEIILPEEIVIRGRNAEALGEFIDRAVNALDAVKEAVVTVQTYDSTLDVPMNMGEDIWP